MTPREFVTKRLAAMERAPGMWASTQEAFGLQLALLVEFTELDKPDMYKTPPGLVMQRIFGPGNQTSNEPLEDDWAKERVSIARFCMEIT